MPDVFLTFDDGPHPTFTPQVLGTLERHGAHATFFQLGKWIVLHPELTRRVRDGGHVIGNHGCTHVAVYRDIDEEVLTLELETTGFAIEHVTGNRPTLFRQPGGAIDDDAKAIAAGLGYTWVSWDIDPRDYAEGATAGAIASEVIQQVRSKEWLEGQPVVLLHDGKDNTLVDVDRSQTVEALGIILSTLEQDGFAFPTL